MPIPRGPCWVTGQPARSQEPPLLSPQSEMGAGKSGDRMAFFSCTHFLVSDTALISQHEDRRRRNLTVWHLQLIGLRSQGMELQLGLFEPFMSLFFFFSSETLIRHFHCPGKPFPHKGQLSSFFLCQVSDDRMSQQGRCCTLSPKATLA